MRPLAKIPGSAALNQFQVIRAGEEVVRQPLYDTQTYAAAGQNSLTFFQDPIGSGTKTEADTNMEASGQLPTGKRFLVETIELMFFPGIVPGNIKTTLAEPEFTNDIWTFGKHGGYLRFFVLAKDQIVEGPLSVFPPANSMQVDSAVSIQRLQAAAANAEDQVDVDYAAWGGPRRVLNPPIMLPSTTNFKITLNWPGGVVALPSGQPAKVMCRLNGLLYRRSQ